MLFQGTICLGTRKAWFVDAMPLSVEFQFLTLLFSLKRSGLFVFGIAMMGVQVFTKLSTI
jgi:hypothetical protein